MTPDQLAEARHRHAKNPYSEHCLWDSEVWPCNAAALRALVDELREAMEEMRTFALHMDGCQFVHDLRTTDDPLQQVRGQCDCGFDEADANARALLNATGGSDDT